MHTCSFSLLILEFYFLNEGMSVSSPCSPLSDHALHSCRYQPREHMGLADVYPAFVVAVPTFC